jgi:DNA polymerase III epsilon subunit-like protein
MINKINNTNISHISHVEMKTEMNGMLQKLITIKRKHKESIEKFIDIDANINLSPMSNVFPGHHKKISIQQYGIAQRLLLKRKYPSTSNHFIFDIETNNAYQKKIVQFAYYVINDKNIIIDKDMFFVFNEGVYTDYYKKIKYKTLKEFGVCPSLLFDKITHVLSQCTTLVGHNIITFDCRIIKKYFLHFGLELEIDDKLNYDTMRESRYLVNLKNKRGGNKSPTLTELSQFFNIGSAEDQFHDAMYDVHITYLCYVNLIIL